MAKRGRQDSAQLNLRLKPAERDRIRKHIPRGSLNAVAVQLLMDYVKVLEAHGPCPRLHPEDPAA